jgi:hypothetical protein
MNIVQDGTDGFGHQLQGFFTSLIFHNVLDYSFDGYEFIKKPFRFEHVNSEEATRLQEYLKKCAEAFMEDFKPVRRSYKSIVRAHEIWKIPKTPSPETLYSLDNVFFFRKLFPNCETQLLSNVERMKAYFINEHLPKSRLNEKNIVIHARMGDAITTGRGNSIHNYNKQIIQLIPKLKKQYPDHYYYIHSDGDVPAILSAIGDNYSFFGKNTPVLEMLSDIIHAKIFIEGNSSLSKVASFIGNQELIITHDDNDHSQPNKNYMPISQIMKSL